jgi:hypothetical protein
MSNIAIHEFTQAVTVATATGTLTVASSAGFYPGAKAWVYLASGANQKRVKILDVPTATTVVVRGYKNNDENSPPDYGLSDMTAFNGLSFISQEGGQTAPVDPAFIKRHVP